MMMINAFALSGRFLNCHILPRVSLRSARGSVLVGLSARLYRMFDVRKLVIVAMMVTLAFSSCIDEDMSDCGKDYTVNYQMRLHTNMQTEIDSELSAPEEQQMARRLEQALADIFSDVARDLDINFYANNELAHHEAHLINAANASFTIYLKAADYRHLAWANVAANPVLTISGQDTDQQVKIANVPNDTIDGHTHGLFTARKDMAVKSESYTFTVPMYMQNCATALVVNRNGVAADDIKAYVVGLANDFSVNDSVYHHERTTAVRTTRMDEGGHTCLHTAGFPSPDGMRSKVGEADGIWSYHVYVTINGKITETKLYVREPLKAAQLKIIKVNLNPDGSVTTEAPEVGVSVTLDWKPGGDYEIEI